MGASPVMAPFAAMGRSAGLHVSSGLRPGAITASGHLSDHAIGKALDMSDGPASMATFFRMLIGNPRVKQAFYDPLGSIFGGIVFFHDEEPSYSALNPSGAATSVEAWSVAAGRPQLAPTMRAVASAFQDLHVTPALSVTACESRQPPSTNANAIGAAFTINTR